MVRSPQALALTRPERLRATINAHDNAVFDVKWSNDDRIIVRALSARLQSLRAHTQMRNMRCPRIHCVIIIVNRTSEGKAIYFANCDRATRGESCRRGCSRSIAPAVRQDLVTSLSGSYNFLLDFLYHVHYR